MTLGEYLELKKKLVDKGWKISLKSTESDIYISVSQFNNDGTHLTLNMFNTITGVDIEYETIFDEDDGVKSVSVWINQSVRRLIDKVIENIDVIEKYEKQLAAGNFVSTKFKICDLVIINYYDKEWEVIDIKIDHLDYRIKYDIRLVNEYDAKEWEDFNGILRDVPEDDMMLKTKYEFDLGDIVTNKSIGYTNFEVRRAWTPRDGYLKGVNVYELRDMTNFVDGDKNTTYPEYDLKLVERKQHGRS